MDHEQFRKWGKEMVDYVADYWQNIRSRRPLPDVKPHFLRTLMPSSAPEYPEKWPKIFEDLETCVMKGTTNWVHPHFFAYYPAHINYAAILGDILSDGINAIGFTWSSCPASTELEMVVLDWIAKILDLPEYFLNSHPGNGMGMIQVYVDKYKL
uniref:Aromatic-L-amino-acid decarboxylase n=1 Tax=Romanomermis culicivorax TaxID=13658 RepID=A0A915I6Y0_ROMCU